MATCKELIFLANPERTCIYDLITKGFKTFTFIRLSEARADWLKQRGVGTVIESWRKGEKSLFSGLLPFSNQLLHGTRITQNGHKSLFILTQPDSNTIKIYLYGYCPKTIKGRNKILNEFLRARKKARGTTQLATSSNQPRRADTQI